jgi:hypothetical protein
MTGGSPSLLILAASEHPWAKPNLTRYRQEEDFRPPLTSAWVWTGLRTAAKRIGDGGRNRRKHRNQGDTS